MSGEWAVLVDVRVLALVGLLVVVLALATLVLSTAARRLDRLHRRADGARAALVEQLVRRAAATDRLARSGLLDPAASVLLAAAAAEALGVGEPTRTGGDAPPPNGSAAPTGTVGPEERVGPGRLAQGRERTESDLSAALRAALPPEALSDLRARPEAEGLLDDLATSCHRLTLARRFANDAQVQVARRRRSRLVRWARLAGRAPAPRTFEVDDEPPPGLLT